MTACRIIFAFCLLAPSLKAAKILEKDLRFFESKVRPLLAQTCYECHSVEKEKAKGGLYLDSRAGWQEGGDSGPAIIPGDTRQSLLLRVVRHEVADTEMPPKNKLTPHQIQILEQWVKRGAPDPRDGATPKKKEAEIDIEAGRRFWSFQPLTKHPTPKVNDNEWPNTDIDRFVLAAIEKKQLTHSGDADAYTLFRRLSYDFLGLPPTPQDADAFAKEYESNSQAAVEEVVDRMLESPAFGERWGRHWLDLARYADSNGGGVNLAYDAAWRYRDYVIRAFNEDKPFDQFVREQIAGDLLKHESQKDRVQKIVATGFLMLGPKALAKYDKDALKMDIVDEQIDTMGRAFLGLTLGCARCHDHKFDPVPTRDYYALAGIFRSSSSIARQRRGPLSDTIKVSLPLKENEQPWYQERKDILGKAFALATQDEPKPKDEAIRIRGLNGLKGEVVPRGFLQVMAPSPKQIPPKNSGRKQLAMWLTDTEKGAGALTARVITNRVWSHLFGEGIVRTADNFGIRGEKPTHPELLDRLAFDFVEKGWSIKSLVRKIATSRAYRSRAVASPDTDPENIYLTRANGRRLDVEAIRDSILMVSGELDPGKGGPTLPYSGRINVPKQMKILKVKTPLKRRSVYLPIIRDSMALVDTMDMFATFDFADPSMVTGDRTSTTVPTQALYLMNSPFVMKQAKHAAKTLLAEDGRDRNRAAQFFKQALGRPATPKEIDRALTLIEKFGGNEMAWTAFCQSIFSCNEFLFIN